MHLMPFWLMQEQRLAWIDMNPLMDDLRPLGGMDYTPRVHILADACAKAGTNPIIG